MEDISTKILQLKQDPRYANLYQQAAELLKKTQNESNRDGVNNLQEALHEINVYQMELLMQNDELQHTQKELQQVNQKYVHLFENAPVGYMIINQHLQILEANKTLCVMLSMTRNQLLKRSLIPFLRSGDSKYFFQFLTDLEHGNKASRVTALKGLDGMYIPVRMDGIKLDLESGDVQYQIALTDMTSQALLEKQLRMIQKTDAVGTLATGIAHDFNNEMNIILGFTNLIADTKDNAEEHSRYLQMILNAGRRATQLAKQILSYQRDVNPHLDLVDITPIVKETFNMIKTLAPANVDVTSMLPASCSPVLTNASSIHEILVNLCTNAIQAMSQNDFGKLHVYLGIAHIAASQGAKKNILPGDYVKLTVSDTGGGIPQKFRQKIFEPMFTTKEHDIGTGLGLYNVKTLVEQQHGYIDFESILGQGTAFHVLFPVQPQQTVVSGVSDEKKILSGSHKLLIIEDSSEQLELYSLALSSLGYYIVGCENGYDALQQLQQNPHHFDVIIVDHRLPDIQGRYLIEQMHELSPATPIILTTGYIGDTDLEKLKEAGVLSFMHKPVLFNELTHLIHHLAKA
ncbi:MAG: response regulator [SAR324 cluster bacterium]|nr:response regulator [SAR324 cluster bacterium]